MRLHLITGRELRSLRNDAAYHRDVARDWRRDYEQARRDHQQACAQVDELQARLTEMLPTWVLIPSAMTGAAVGFLFGGLA